MDFRLTDEQTLMVDTARSLFTRECPTRRRPPGGRRAEGGVRPVRPAPPRVGGAGGRARRSTSASSSSRRARSSPRDPSCPPPAASPRCSERRATRWPTTRWPARSPAPSRWRLGPTGGCAPPTSSSSTRSRWSIDGSRLAVVDASAVEARPVETLDLARSMSFVTVPDGARPRAARGGRARPTPPSGPRWPSRRSWSAWPAGWSTRRWPTPRNGCSSACPSARSRPCSTGWSTSRSATRRRPRPCRYAAMCVDADDPDRARAVHVAKARAGAAARRAAKDAMQLHGGIGYTYEHDLHLRLRRAYADDALFGTGAWHLDQLADLLFV